GMYLVDALSGPRSLPRSLGRLSAELMDELRDANFLRQELSATVVLGNPPYSGISANNNAWIEHLLKGQLIGPGGERSYYEVDGRPLGERKVWLQDDYVKFFRYGQWHIDRAGTGVLAYLSNHGFL